MCSLSNSYASKGLAGFELLDEDPVDDPESLKPKAMKLLSKMELMVSSLRKGISNCLGMIFLNCLSSKSAVRLERRLK